MRITLIALFGAVGTLTRYGLQMFAQAPGGGGSPVATMFINLTGCFLLAVIGQYTLNRAVISPDLRLAIAVGFFGGYTTFSGFGWEAAKMMESGQWSRVTAYVSTSVVAGIALTIAGMRLANRL